MSISKILTETPNSEDNQTNFQDFLERSMENVIEILRQRGFIDSVTDENVKELVTKPIRVYCGFDPTADSLHLGNLVGIMGLAWFQKCGHTPVAIVGGATGMIGDPSGKNSERQFLTSEMIDSNLDGIRKNLEKILNQSGKPFILLNNYDWYQKFSLIDFLKNVGKFFRVGPMLAKESVKKRLESEEGMSFTEFSYQTLQGYDFLHLYREHQVVMEIGGTDQWGNITAGTELTRKVTGDTVYGLTFPLIVKSDGQKFGKSEKGAIWLSAEKLSPYEFYQHLFRTADSDVIQLLRMLTFLPMDEILHIERNMQSLDYVPNTAQKVLAQEVTRIVHGEEALKVALQVTQAAAPGASIALDGKILMQIAKNMPSRTMLKQDVLGKDIVSFLLSAGLFESKAQARKMIENGGVYLNNSQLLTHERNIYEKDIIDQEWIVISLGKKNKLIVQLT